jgi:hypothetical protein
MIVVKSIDGTFRVWALSLGGSAPHWTELSPSGEAPPGRGRLSLIYDSRRDRAILFGGLELGKKFNDVWSLSLSGDGLWQQMIPSGPAPSTRFYHSAIYDPNGDRMVVFGGYGIEPDGTAWYRNETWELSLDGDPEWREVSPTGEVPRPITGHRAVYDPFWKQMLVYGGRRLESVYALSLTGNPEWKRLSPEGANPPGRTSTSAIYDLTRNRMIIYGGGAIYNDSWALSVREPRWDLILPTDPTPQGRTGHTLVYDPRNHRFLMFGLSGGYWEDRTQELWEFRPSDSQLWRELEPGGDRPPLRYGQAALLDLPRNRMLVIGGLHPFDRTRKYYNDVWALNLTDPLIWKQMAPAGLAPEPRTEHTAIYDSRRERVLVFGGWNGQFLDDLWALTLGGNLTWHRLSPIGEGPDARSNHSAIYDYESDRMIIYGGWDGEAKEDTWSLSLAGEAEWQPIITAGTQPRARSDHSAVYDCEQRRMLVFGGPHQWPPHFENVWSLSLESTPTWRELITANAPPSIYKGHAAAFDPWQYQMIVFGGYGGWGWTLGDTWSISLQQNTPPAATIDVKPGHPHNRINLNSRGNLTVAVLSSPSLDATTLATQTLTTAGARVRQNPGGQYAVFARDVNGDELIDLVAQFPIQDLKLKPSSTELLLCGLTLGGRRVCGRDRIEIIRPGTQDPENDLSVSEIPEEPQQLALHVLGQSPAVGVFSVQLIFPVPGPAELTIYTVTGRRVGLRRFEVIHPETQIVELPREMFNSSGVYLVRLTQARTSTTAKITFLRR